MSKPIQVSLRAGERVYINGAVVRVDRKATLELMNDVVFLLESHVLQPEDTTTPLRQLYFILQSMLMDPGNAGPVMTLFRNVHASTIASFANAAVLAGLKTVRELVEAGRIFEALRTIRGLFPTEDAILGTASADGTRAA
jgi:flagellar protein FlbT